MYFSCHSSLAKFYSPIEKQTMVAIPSPLLSLRRLSSKGVVATMLRSSDKSVLDGRGGSSQSGNGKKRQRRRWAKTKPVRPTRARLQTHDQTTVSVDEPCGGHGHGHAHT